VEQYVGNPLNSFILIKKLTSDWKLVKELISSTSTAEKFLSNLTDTSQSKFRKNIKLFKRGFLLKSLSIFDVSIKTIYGLDTFL
jgi:hypothetical protein